MKTLYLIRHAKSSWEDASLDDIDRPLNERGKHDAPRMGKRLKEKEVHPDLMLTSPAKRAYGTCKRIAEAIGYPRKNITEDIELYHASAEKILAIVQALPEKTDCVMLFGHNPGFTDLANMLLRGERVIENVPTCGIVCFSFESNQWRHASATNARMMFFDYPKSKND